MEEMWKPIKNYEGYYEVSNLGRVRSVDRIINGRHIKGQILKPWKTRGYLCCCLSKNNCGNKYAVHRLVLETFNPIDGMKNLECDHIDFNTENNCINNLQWLTADENLARRRHYQHTEEAKQRISNSKKKQVKCIEENIIFNSLNEAAEWAKLSNSAHISECCRGKRKTCAGFHWEFINQN